MRDDRTNALPADAGQLLLHVRAEVLLHENLQIAEQALAVGMAEKPGEFRDRGGGRPRRGWPGPAAAGPILLVRDELQPSCLEDHEDSSIYRILPGEIGASAKSRELVLVS